MRLAAIFVVAWIISLCSCQPTPFYLQEANLSSTGWHYDAPQQFEFEISDTSKRYDLSLQIDHNTVYEYQNLYLHLTTFFPNQDSIQQALSVDLADAQGRWYGKCSTKNCSVVISLQQNTFFNQFGVHKIRISQHMRVDPIENIDALTLSLNERKSQ